MSEQHMTPTVPPTADPPVDRTGETGRTEDALRHEAVTRLEDRAGFRAHLLTYVLVNLMIIGIWAFSGGGFFWPFYPLAGWGIGLALHAYGTWSGAPTEAKVQAQLRRMTR